MMFGLQTLFSKKKTLETSLILLQEEDHKQDSCPENIIFYIGHDLHADQYLSLIERKYSLY